MGESGIEQSQTAREFILAIENHREFASGAVAILFADTVAENPRVTGAQLSLGSRGHTEAQAGDAFINSHLLAGQ